MNVYQKLQKCRVELQNMNLKKTGNNKFAGFTYFELSDFLPTINELCEKHGLFTRTSFTSELAMLEVINAEAPEEVILFTSPQAEATLKGCHAIQNVGAVETYQRRYLLMVAFEIVENDSLDPTVTNDKKNTPAKGKTTISQAQLNRLYAIASKKGYDKPSVDALIKKKHNVEPANMTKAKYDEIVKGYEGLEDKKEEA